jgi:hypothetical protein
MMASSVVLSVFCAVESIPAGFCGQQPHGASPELRKNDAYPAAGSVRITPWLLSALPD